MLNKEDIKQLIKKYGNIYCTTETGRQAHKNAFNGLVTISDLKNPVEKFVGIFEGDFYGECYTPNEHNEVFDGDAVYILVEKGA